MAKEIRLRYAGFIVFAAKMLSVATGLIFQLMIARATTKLEYGIWFNIYDVAAYFTLLAGVLPFWTMRFMARGREGAAKTGILANLTLSLIATLIYLSLVSLITSALGVGEQYLPLYFLMAIQIIERYAINALEACLRAKIPQVIGYGLLIAECCKVVLGYILIIHFQQPLLGAMLSLITAIAMQTVYYFMLLKEEFRQHVTWEYVREWVKGSVANIYHIVGNHLAAFILILLFTYGGEGARGNYGAAAQIASVITYASSLGFALYPKLLADRRSEDITTSLKTVCMFAIPMTVGAITLSDSYIIIMKEVYKEAWPIVMVLAINALITTISGLFSAVLFGVERLDEKAQIGLRALVKSPLFKMFSLPYLRSAVILPAAFYVLTTHTQDQPIEAAFSVSVLNTLASVATCLILYGIARKLITIDVHWSSIGRYVFASAVMATALYVLPHPTRISVTLGITAIGGIIYFSTLTAIDREARRLVATVWEELKSIGS